MSKISKKTKGLILIALGITIALLGIFILNSKNSEKEIKNLPALPEQQIQQLSKNQPNTIKTILEIDNKKLETEISENSSVYDFMNKLKTENKITFKEKTYTGMGKFIEEINNIKNSGELNWIYYVNNQKANIGISNYKIKPGDVVSWKYEASN